MPFRVSNPPRANTPPPTAAGTLIVQSGDRLARLAAANGTTVPELVAANVGRYPSLATNPNLIRAGWTLVLPGQAARPPVADRPRADAFVSAANQGQPTQRAQIASRPDALGLALGAGGAQAIDRKMKGHLEAIEKTGVGLFYGDHSSWKTMTPQDRAAWVEANKVPGSKPGTPRESSCIGWALENVGDAYRAAGKGARWEEIFRTVVSKGSKGTDLAKELKKDGWESVYWNPDAKNPADGLAEHSFSASQVAKGRGYYGIEVDHTVQNYRPTDGKGTALDPSGTEKLNKVPFFFGLAKGGMHTFVGRAGNVNEFHWNEMPNGKGAIEERPLKDFPWNSGLIMVPPGSWPK